MGTKNKKKYEAFQKRRIDKRGNYKHAKRRREISNIIKHEMLELNWRNVDCGYYRAQTQNRHNNSGSIRSNTESQNIAVNPKANTPSNTQGMLSLQNTTSQRKTRKTVKSKQKKKSQKKNRSKAAVNNECGGWIVKGR